MKPSKTSFIYNEEEPVSEGKYALAAWAELHIPGERLEIEPERRAVQPPAI